MVLSVGSVFEGVGCGVEGSAGMCLGVHSCARLQGRQVSLVRCISRRSLDLRGSPYPAESGRAAMRQVSQCSSLIEGCGYGAFCCGVEFGEFFFVGEVSELGARAGMYLCVHSCARLQERQVSLVRCIFKRSLGLRGSSYPAESGRAAMQQVS